VCRKAVHNNLFPSSLLLDLNVRQAMSLWKIRIKIQSKPQSELDGYALASLSVSRTWNSAVVIGGLPYVCPTATVRVSIESHEIWIFEFEGAWKQ